MTAVAGRVRYSKGALTVRLLSLKVALLTDPTDLLEFLIGQQNRVSVLPDRLCRAVFVASWKGSAAVRASWREPAGLLVLFV